MKTLILILILFELNFGFSQETQHNFQTIIPLEENNIFISYRKSHLSNFQSIKCNEIGNYQNYLKEGLFNYHYKNRLIASIYYENNIPKYEIMYDKSKINAIFFVNKLDTIYSDTINKETSMKIYMTYYDSAYFFKKNGDIKFIYYFLEAMAIEKCVIKNNCKKCKHFELKDEFPAYMWYFFIDNIKEKRLFETHK